MSFSGKVLFSILISYVALYIMSITTIYLSYHFVTCKTKRLCYMALNNSEMTLKGLTTLLDIFKKGA